MKAHQLTSYQLHHYQNMLDTELKNHSKLRNDEQLAAKNIDVSENTPLDIAKEKIAISEAKIQKLEEIIDNAEIVESVFDGITVSVNTKVTIEDITTHEQYSFEFVETDGEYPDKVSKDSKLGSLLDKKTLGTTISYIDNAHTPRMYKIIKVAILS